jgi:tripartite-type tricarboxylate transporter receptor subunit TctC
MQVQRHHAIRTLAALAARTAAGAAFVLSALLSSQVASAQTAPIRIVVGFPPGGSSDVTARLVAEKMQASLGAPVIVDNKPGAGGRIAAQGVKEAAADGTTLMLAPFAVMVVQPAVFRSIKYDTTADFTPIGNVVNFPLALAAGPATPATSVQELVAWLKAHPAQGNYGSPGAGSMPHFLGEMLGAKAGVKLTHVPFQGGAPLTTNLLGGQIPIGFDTPAEFAEHHHSGKLRILALSGGSRSPRFPGVPTLREAGIDIDALAWFALFAPAATPKPTVERLNAALQAALKQPDVIDRLDKLGLLAAPSGADDMAKRLASDKADWHPIIKNSGLQLD